MREPPVASPFRRASSTALLCVLVACCAHFEEDAAREPPSVESGSQAAHFERGVQFEAQGRVVDAVAEYTASVDAGAEDDVGDAAHALDRLLRSDADVPADLRRRAWDAVVAKHPTNPHYANAASRWYAEVARDPTTSRRYEIGAAKATPERDVDPTEDDEPAR